jgi:hypothetical protein
VKGGEICLKHKAKKTVREAKVAGKNQANNNQVSIVHKKK